MTNSSANIHQLAVFFSPLTNIVALALLVGVVLYARAILQKYIHIMIKLMDEQAPDLTPQPLPRTGDDLIGHEVTFSAADGHPLAGVIINGNPNATTTGMIIFAHEVGSDRTSCKRYCLPLLDAGYDVFAFDFRGHGASPPQQGYEPRQWPSEKEKADMQGAIDFISTRLTNSNRPNHIAVIGVSRGAGAAILAGIHNPRVRAIITDGMFSSDETMEYFMRRFATTFAGMKVVARNHPPIFWRFFRWLLFRQRYKRFGCKLPSVRKALAKVGGKPILIIHGEKDSYIPVSQSQMLYDATAGPKDLWIVPGAKHGQGAIFHADLYAQRILRFLNEHVTVTTPQPQTSHARAQNVPILSTNTIIDRT